MVNGGPICLVKQRRIDELEEEIKGLRAKLRYQERKEQDGYPVSSTPSSKRPVRPNSEHEEKRPKGARFGHNGVGRRSHEEGMADRIVKVDAESEICPGLIVARCSTTYRKTGDIPNSGFDENTEPKAIAKILVRFFPDNAKSFHCGGSVDAG